MKISNIGPMLHSCYLAGDAPLINGEAGIGKTDSVKQFAEANNCHMELLLLGNQEVGDLIGLPVIEHVQGNSCTNWSVPIWLKHMQQAAWPEFCHMDDLIFNDKDFEKFVLDNYAPEKI